jgi:hypothetical protein
VVAVHRTRSAEASCSPGVNSDNASQARLENVILAGPPARCIAMIWSPNAGIAWLLAQYGFV